EYGRLALVVRGDADPLAGEEGVDHADEPLLAGAVAELRQVERGRQRRIVPRCVADAVGERGAPAGDLAVIRVNPRQHLEIALCVVDSTEPLRQLGREPEAVGEAALPPAGEGALDLDERGAGPAAGELEPRQLEADEPLA